MTNLLVVLNLDHPSTWPHPLLAALAEYEQTFRAWELDLPEKSHQTFEPAMTALGQALQPYAIRGWHCTRLTPREAREVETNGLDILGDHLIKTRISALVHSNEMDADVAEKILTTNLGTTPTREGRAWFCFQAPWQMGKSGIMPPLQIWGGEAIYANHEGDPIVGTILRRLGTPILVEADIPVSYLPSPDRIATAVSQTYLKHKGCWGVKPGRLQHFATKRISPPLLRRLIRFPDPEFALLTGCDTLVPTLHA
jgi:hypothetical protein